MGMFDDIYILNLIMLIYMLDILPNYFNKHNVQRCIYHYDINWCMM